MSGQIHADFLRLLWVLTDKQLRSYYENMDKEDKIGSEVFRWARDKVFKYNKTSVVVVVTFGCATRCHLSVHSLAIPHSGLDDVSHVWEGRGSGVVEGRGGRGDRGGRGRGGGGGVGGGGGGWGRGGGNGGGGGGGGRGGGERGETG